MTESTSKHNPPTVTLQNFQKAETKAAEWKRKAVERREAIEELKVRLGKLEAAFIKDEELVKHLQNENASLEDEVNSMKHELEVSNKSLEKLRHENQDFKKKYHF